MSKKSKIPLSVFLLFLISSNVSCHKDLVNEKKTEVVVKLTKQMNVGPFVRRLSPFTPSKLKVSEFENIPNADSLLLQQLTLSSPTKLEQLISDGIVSKEQGKRFINTYYAVSGTRNGKRFFILDENRNRDFDDDIISTFTYDQAYLAKDSIEIRNQFKNTILKYNMFIDDSLTGNAEKYVKIYPYPDYFRFTTTNDTTKLLSKFQLISETSQHWAGNLNENNTIYNFAISFDQYEKGAILIKKANDSFPKPSNPQYFKHRFGDTIRLDSSYFHLNRVNHNRNALTINKIDDLENYYGYLLGDKIENVRFSNLKGKDISIKQAFEEKNYLLLDFWGTWCKPCLALTPQLLEINQKYEEINLLSIAFERSASKKNVIDYIEKNNMNWSHTYELKDNLNKQNSFTHNLKVKTFPTFILLNKELEIIYRGIGEMALKDLEAFLQNK